MKSSNLRKRDFNKSNGKEKAEAVNPAIKEESN